MSSTPRQPPNRLAPCGPGDDQGVLLHNGKYLSVLCGVDVDVTTDERPLVVIKASGGKPNMRAIMLGTKELHACQMGTAWQKRDLGES